MNFRKILIDFRILRVYKLYDVYQFFLRPPASWDTQLERWQSAAIFPEKPSVGLFIYGSAFLFMVRPFLFMIRPFIGLSRPFFVTTVENVREAPLPYFLDRGGIFWIGDFGIQLVFSCLWNGVIFVRSYWYIWLESIHEISSRSVFWTLFYVLIDYDSRLHKVTESKTAAKNFPTG